MEYVTNRLIKKIVNEVSVSQFSLFTSHALIKTTTKDYIKESQIRMILEPVAKSIREKLGSKKIILQCMLIIYKSI